MKKVFLLINLATCLTASASHQAILEKALTQGLVGDAAVFVSENLALSGAVHYLNLTGEFYNNQNRQIISYFPSINNLKAAFVAYTAAHIGKGILEILGMPEKLSSALGFLCIYGPTFFSVFNRLNRPPTITIDLRQYGPQTREETAVLEEFERLAANAQQQQN